MVNKEGENSTKIIRPREESTLGDLRKLEKNIVGKVFLPVGSLQVYLVVKESPILAVPFTSSAATPFAVIEITAPDDIKILLLDEEEWINKYPQFWKDAQESWNIGNEDDNVS